MVYFPVREQDFPSREEMREQLGIRKISIVDEMKKEHSNYRKWQQGKPKQINVTFHIEEEWRQAIALKNASQLSWRQYLLAKSGDIEGIIKRLDEIKKLLDDYTRPLGETLEFK